MTTFVDNIKVGSPTWKRAKVAEELLFAARQEMESAHNSGWENHYRGQVIGLSQALAIMGNGRLPLAMNVSDIAQMAYDTCRTIDWQSNGPFLPTCLGFADRVRDQIRKESK